MLALSVNTENGIELIGAENLSQLRSLLDGRKPILTQETAQQIVSAVQALYETGTAFVMPELNDLPFEAADESTETIDWLEWLHSQETVEKPLASADDGQAFLLKKQQIEQLNRMICRVLTAYTPSDYMFEAYEVYGSALDACNTPFFMREIYLVTGGEYDTPEEALALIRERSDRVEYIRCDGSDAYYCCGDAQVRLTFDAWSTAEYLAYWEDYQATDEYRALAKEYEQLLGSFAE